MSGPDHRFDEPDPAPAERARLQRALGALTPEDEARVEPPPEVWRGITAVLAAEGPERPEAPVPPPAAVAPVVALDEHRARRRRQALVGAVAAAVVLVAGVVALAGRDDPSSGPELVAAAALEPIGSVVGVSADVELVRTDGAVELALEADGMGPAPAGTHYELWLLDPSSPDAEPVSLGSMSASTTATVPDGVDLDDYRVVDVSLQEEGQVEHSGNSLLRGTLA